MINGIIHSVFRESISKKQSGLHFLYFLRKLPKNCVCKPSFLSTAYETIKVFSKSSSFIHSFTFHTRLFPSSNILTMGNCMLTPEPMNYGISQRTQEILKFVLGFTFDYRCAGIPAFRSHHLYFKVGTQRYIHDTCRRMPFKLQVKNLFMTHDFRILS